jgi:hypothetical protein
MTDKPVLTPSRVAATERSRGTTEQAAHASDASGLQHTFERDDLRAIGTHRRILGARVVSSRTVCRRFAFGAVAFELLTEERLEFRLPRAYAEHTQEVPHVATLADAICTLRIDPGLRSQRFIGNNDPPIWEKTETGMRVSTSRIAAEVTTIGLHCFAVAARMRAAEDLSALLLVLTATVVELAGGLYLHATAVELDGAAVLLLGPSGAGKTTAAQLLGDVSCLAHDRVIVVPALDAADGGGFWVWALPGGSPPMLAKSTRRVLPLSACVRIRQAREKSAVVRVPLAQAYFLVREAVEIAIDSGFHEANRLDASAALASNVPVAIAHVVLSQNWAHELQLCLREPFGPLSRETASRETASRETSARALSAVRAESGVT